jgi:hypothetical protein
MPHSDPPPHFPRPCTDALLAHHTAGVIFIKAFVTQRALSRTALQQTRGFLVGEYSYMTLFIDTDKSLKVYTAWTVVANGRCGDCIES